MAATSDHPHDGAALLDEMAHWTGVIGQAQQLLMEHGAGVALKMADDAAANMPMPDPAGFANAPGAMWAEALGMWRSMLPAASGAGADRRFAAPQWQEPLFDLIRQGYAALSAELIARMDAVEGLEPRQKEQLSFAMRNMVDAMSPANFALTNPLVVEKIIETRGANLLTGLERMLDDAASGQLRHVGKGAFEVGRNIATTPGKVIHETPLYQLIQYSPATPDVHAIPLLIFPPWINRFYILDLSPEKSFVRWAVAQGLTVFMVSWKSADASLAGVTMDDYVLKGQLDAIETVTTLLDVPNVNAVGYCVAGTALSMLLAWAAANDKAGLIASATFFTTQVDFADAGELLLFVDDAQIGLLGGIAKDGVVDGRYMATAFNLLRGRDLIWNTVVDHYLLANDYKPFDLLHWNSDVTNLSAEWQRAYLADLYRDNALVEPGRLSLAGTPIDLRRIETPSYVQAGREDHIAPPESVWKLTHHFAGPLRFVLAGSGHIAGVINPPSANKYGYWINEGEAGDLAAFVEGASEYKGSWWPDWLAWLAPFAGEQVPAKGARIPGEGALKAIEDAPGRYVKTR